MLSPAMAKLLRICVKSRLNIVISGGTGAGKTTLMNTLSREIGDTERLVTIETPPSCSCNSLTWCGWRRAP